MRARRSAIPLPMRRRGRPGPPPAAPRRLDPRSRSRRLVGVFASGATAFRSVRCGRCDGVARGPAGASAVGRGGPKGRERPGQALRPQFKSSGARAQPCAARASAAGSRSPQKSVRPAGGLRDEGTSTATRTSPARVSYASFSRFSRARARGRGIPGVVEARDSSSVGLVFAGVAAAPRRSGPRVFALGGGGLTKRLQRPPLRSPFLTPSPRHRRTLSRPATVHR